MRQDVSAFIAGHKPSVLIENDVEELKTLFNRKFPHLELEEGCWFFQDSHSLEWARINLSKQSLDNAKKSLVGLLLGYPPGAVQRYVNGESCDVKVNYSGIEFQTSYDTLVDDITWMWNVRPVEKDFNFYLDVSMEEEKHYYYSSNGPTLDKVVQFLRSTMIEREVLV